MGFNPIQGAYYYIVAKHSNKVLEVANAGTNAGDFIVQNELAAGTDFSRKQHQQFSIEENHNRVHVFRVRHTGFVLDIRGNTSEDRALAIQQPWNGGDNQRFRIMDAGDGSYYLQAVNSGKVLDVFARRVENGADVVQYTNNRIDHPQQNNDHQHFRLVVASENFQQGALPGFSSPSQMIREAAIGAIGLVPTAGGALKGLLGHLWPDAAPKMVWRQVTQYVEQYVQSALNVERLNRLQDGVEASFKSAKSYDGLSPGTEKAAALTALVISINTIDQPFFTRSQPENALPFVMLLGNLKLTLMQERARFYPAIAGVAHDDNLASHLLDLREGIRDYVVAAKRMRQQFLQQRIDRIGQNVHMYRVHTSRPREWIFDFVLTDGFDGSQHYLRLWPKDGSASSIVQNAFRAKLIAWRQNTVRQQYASYLDGILLSANLWPSFDPNQPRPVERTVTASLGPYGTPFGDTIDLVGEQSISKIRFYGDSKLRGIVVEHRSGTSKRLGHELGDATEITLRDGEHVVAAFGSTNVEIIGLWLETNFGQRLIGGDRDLGSRFDAELSSDVRPRLKSLSGTASNDRITSLSFEWTYTILGDLPDLQRRSRRSKAKTKTKAKAKVKARTASSSRAKLAQQTKPKSKSRSATKAAVRAKPKRKAKTKPAQPTTAKPKRVKSGAVKGTSKTPGRALKPKAGAAKPTKAASKKSTSTRQRRG
ncbi:RICIN domain-containing protein [Ahniella affigens]|nr:RICIN domain-containing protein [Ahniella affigens]